MYYFIIEKDPFPAKISRPWRYRFSGVEGIMKAHTTGGFKTKKQVTELCDRLSAQLDIWIEEGSN